MVARPSRGLRIVALIAAATGLRCAILTDLDGLSGGDARQESDAGADVAPVKEAGGPVELPDGEIELVDDDAADFGAGTFDATGFAGDRVALVSAVTTGRFTSRIHDTGRDVAIASLRWVPGAPYGKPLPDLGVADGAYRAGVLDMRDNVLLLHFDGAAGPLVGTVADRSGGSNDAIVKTSASLVADGIFGAALRDDISGYVAVPISAASGLNFGVSDVTWAYWVRSTQDCPIVNPPSGNRVQLGYEETTGDKTHVWLGCSSTAGSSCENPDGTGRAGGTWCSRKVPAGDCSAVCGRTTINDGRWHHVALVKRGHSPGTLKLFVDGKPDAAEAPTAFESPIAVAPGVEMGVGAFSNGTFAAAGDFDEIAIWRRALSDEEIRSSYLRGMLSLALRVRVCATPDCAGAADFGGPSADVPAFADRPGEGPVGTFAAPLRGRYFQYEVQLDSRAAAETPELFEVRLRGKFL